MLLQLTRDELKLLANLLNQSEHGSAERLLDRVLANNLRFDADELLDLNEILAARSIALRGEINRAEGAELRPALLQEQQRLQSAIDKVTEACAMA
jgi:hypothetical protein